MSPEFSEAVKEAAIDRAEELFRLAWGEPQRPAAKQWRARDGSARAMWVQGPKRGRWHDFKSGAGGDVLEFVAVEFCGLSSAKDDFPRVLEEAARLCGIAKDEAPNLAQLEARKAERQKTAERATEAEDAQRAATVTGLQERASAAALSPAAAYLKGRGIDALPASGLANLPPVPGMAVLHPHRPALVVWAQDDFGRIMGGQRILICEDGGKAPEDPRKPSFGRISGYPARFPALRENSPLCMAEGPETALAIWQATGFEVWAVFGADFFATAPAPTGRQVILCPDADACDSQAAKAFERGCEALAARGCEVWIARPPEPKGSKRDFADTLKEQGPEAVAKALQSPVKFTPRDASGRFAGAGAIDCEPVAIPEFLEVAEARERIRQAIRKFLEDAARFSEAKADWQAYCDSGASDPIPPEMTTKAEIATAPPPVLAIAASPGIGKSRIAREELARFELARFSGDVVFHAPTMKLAEEAAAHAQELQAGWHVTRGRSAMQPGSGYNGGPPLLPMCARSEEAERAARAGLRVKPTLCERKTEDGLELCPHHATCPYVQQWLPLDNAPALRFEASVYLKLPSDGSGRKTGLRVIDETIWREFARTADLPFDAWLRPRRESAALPIRKGRKKPPTEAERAEAAGKATDATKAAHDVLKALQDGKDLQSLPYSAEDFREFAEMERGPDVLNIGPGSPDDAIRAALKAHEAGDRYDSKRAAVWAVLADALEAGVETSERLRIVRDVPAPGLSEPRDVLRVCWFVEPPRDAPVLLLDADADAEITERLFPGARIVRAEVRPNAEVVQVSDMTFSKRALSSKKTRQKLAALVRAEVLADRLQGVRGVLAIATKQAVRQFFEDAGHSLEGKTERQISAYMMATELHGARWLWFGPAALGLNDWKEFGTAVVIGREELPTDVLEDYLRAIKGDTGEPLRLAPRDERGGNKLPRAMQPYLMADGSGRAVTIGAHPDKLGRALQVQGREMATRQGFERLRLATATERKRVVLACNVPIPGLPVDKLVSWQELAPSRFEAAMAEVAQRGGVLRLSATGLAKDAPETFPTAKAAGHWISRESQEAVNTPAPLIRYSISGMGVLNPVRVRLRLQGQRGPLPTPALVVLPGDARAIAEAQLGPLSSFELVDDRNLIKPDIAPDAAQPDFSDVTTREDAPPKMSENAPAPVPEEFFGVPEKELDTDFSAVTTRGEPGKVPSIKESATGEVVPADDFVWRRAERIAAKEAERRPQIVQAIKLAPSSAFAKVAAAIEAENRTPGAVATATGLGATRAYRTIDAMKAAGVLREGRDGRLSLQRDALPPDREEAAPAPVVLPSGVVALPRPARKPIILPEAEQIDSEIMRDFLRRKRLRAVV